MVDLGAGVLVVHHPRLGMLAEGRVDRDGCPVVLGEGTPDVTDGAAGGADIRYGALDPFEHGVGLGDEADGGVLEIHHQQLRVVICGTPLDECGRVSAG